MERKRIAALGLLAIGLMLGAPPLARATPITAAVEYTSTGILEDSRPFTLGYSFTLSDAVTVNALAYWDDGLGHSHQVGIWDSAGTLLTSTTVLGTDEIQGHFRWHPIADLILSAGLYTIGGEYLGNLDPFPSGAVGIVTIPQYAWETDRQVGGAGLNFPTFSTGGGYGDNGILAANFSVTTTAVPEPASLILLGSGLVLVAARRRFKQRA